MNPSTPFWRRFGAIWAKAVQTEAIQAETGATHDPERAAVGADRGRGAAADVSPLRQGTPEDPDAPERTRLLTERDRLYTELAALHEDDPKRPDLERRAALTLRGLDALPPAVQGNPRRTGRLARSV